MNQLAAVRRFNTIAGRFAPALAATIADRRFWHPRRLPMRDWEQDIAARAERITTRFGLSALRWGGPGPTVLMLHGWEGRPTQFAALIAPLLAAGRRVIALDAPAHGQSPGHQADPVAFADALLEISAELPRLEAVIGHSMGAAAVAIALSRGLRTDRAVLIAGPASLSGVMDRGASAVGLTATTREHLLRLTEQRIGLAVSALDVAVIGKTLQVPALIVHDQDDDQVPVAEAEAIASAWTGARLLRTRGLGHWRVLRDAGVVSAISEFAIGGRPIAQDAMSPGSKEAQPPRQRAPKMLRNPLDLLAHYG